MYLIRILSANGIYSSMAKKTWAQVASVLKKELDDGKKYPELRIVELTIRKDKPKKERLKLHAPKH